MARVILVNGRPVEPGDPVIAADDPGLLGQGVYESLRTYGGRSAYRSCTPGGCLCRSLRECKRLYADPEQCKQKCAERRLHQAGGWQSPGNRDYDFQERFEQYAEPRHFLLQGDGFTRRHAQRDLLGRPRL